MTSVRPEPAPEKPPPPAPEKPPPPAPATAPAADPPEATERAGNRAKAPDNGKATADPHPSDCQAAALARADVARFLGALFAPQDLLLVRPIETWVEEGKKRSRTLYRHTIHVEASHLATDGELWDRLGRMAEGEHANLFFGVCPRFGGGGRYDLAWQVRTVRVLWADLDNCTPAEALKRCEAAGLPAPSVVVASGHGVHLYWLLSEAYLVDDAGRPLPVFTEFIGQGTGKKKLARKYVLSADGAKVYARLDNNRINPEFPGKLSPKAQRVQHILAGVASAAGGDHTTDLARILRLPGTMNRKDERNGKAPAPCVLVECDPARRYPFTLFERFACAHQAAAGEAARVRLPSGRKLTPERLNRLAGFINACAAAGDRSGADFHLCCHALRRGYDKEAIWAEVADVGKFGQRGRDYFDLTWDKAEKKVKEEVREQLSRRACGQDGAGGNGQESPPGSPGSPCSPCSHYDIDGGRLCRRRYGEGGEHLEPLCNFVAGVVREQVLDDGSGEVSHTFAVEGKLDTGEVLPRVSVSAADFPAMNWPIREWGLRAVVFAGQGNRDHVRVAIQQASRGAERCRIYKHTGWRQEGGAWLYLHAGGAVGAGDTVRTLRVELDGKLAHYLLPDPPKGEALAAAVGAELRLLGFGRPRLAYPLLGAVYRAALGGADCSLALVGKTGLGKSELSALYQQHYGAGMHRLDLPGNWSSTANALESLAFLAKDALLVIDDFKPGGSRSEIDQMHAKAERVLRAQGNSSGRQRCRPDGTVRADRPPRGLVLTSGEDLPRGESLRARVLVLQVQPDDFAISDLTPFQRDAAGGLYAQALAGFLHWLAPEYEAVRARLPGEHAELRRRAAADACHPRTPGIIADLALGLRWFLNFAVAAGVVSAAERKDLVQAAWPALLEAESRQAQEVRSQDPGRRFVRLVAAVITSERAHLAGRDGGQPDEPAAWGWYAQTVATREGSETVWQARGQLLGWVHGEEVYLDPDAAYAEAQRLADAQGERLALSQQQLQRRLKDDGLLASTEKDKTTIRRRLQGKDRGVLHLRAGDLSPQEQGEQGGQGEVP